MATFSRAKRRQSNAKPGLKPNYGAASGSPAKAAKEEQPKAEAPKAAEEEQSEAEAPSEEQQENALAAAATVAAAENENVEVPPCEMLHEGNKLYWRINRTIDFRIFLCESEKAVVLRGFDPKDNFEFPVSVFSLPLLQEQVDIEDAKHAAIDQQISGAGYVKEEKKEDRKEDNILLQRRLRAEAERRSQLTPELIAEEAAEKAREAREAQEKAVEERKKKLSGFIIARIEAGKAKASDGPTETGIVFGFRPRPSDNFTSVDFESPSPGLMCVGEHMYWNKAEDARKVRRASASLMQDLNDSSTALKKADDQAKAMKLALEAVQDLVNREAFNALPSHHKLFVRAVKKAMFQERLIKIQVELDASPVYQALMAEQEAKRIASATE